MGAVASETTNFLEKNTEKESVEKTKVLVKLYKKQQAKIDEAEN